MRLPATLLTVLCSVAVAEFSPAVRVDRQNNSRHGCYHAAITAGPESGFGRPLYVAIQDDSLEGIVSVRSDIVFQTSTDNGTTWLGENRVVRRGETFAAYPDVTADARDGLYIVYTERPTAQDGHIFCVRSTDAGRTWSAPTQVDDNPQPVAVGWARICADESGDLLAAWNQQQGNYMRIFSSVSTDRGATWSPRVRVDDDTVPSDAFHTDVFAQPGTGHYLVAATAPYWVRPGNISSHAMLYRSTDRGATFRPGVQLDTFGYYTGQPHVVADSEHIICDYTGSGSGSGNQILTESRTFYTTPDTWGPPVPVTDLDTAHSSYYNGGKLAISAGAVHTALMIYDMLTGDYDIYYASSADHGASWSVREQVNNIPMDLQADPDIAVDRDGHAYIIWQDQRNNRDETWFSTNNPLAVEEEPKPPAADFRLSACPTVFRDRVTIRVLSSPVPSPQPPAPVLSFFDASGRLVRVLSLPRPLTPGPHSLSWSGLDASGTRLPAGLYLIRYGTATAKVTLLPAD